MSIFKLVQGFPLPTLMAIVVLSFIFPSIAGKAGPLTQNIPVPKIKPLAREVIVPTPKLKPPEILLAHKTDNKAAHIAQTKTDPWQASYIKKIEKYVRLNRPTYALSLLQKDDISKRLSSQNFDHLQSLIAFSYLFENRIDTAKNLAKKSLERSGAHTPLAGWVLGLVYWQAEDFLKAAQSFEVAAKSAEASEWTVSAASYWAARSYMRSGKTGQVHEFLGLAANHPRTFYGLIATRALGKKTPLNWSIPAYKKNYLKILEKYDTGKEALHFIQQKQYIHAENVLRKIHVKERDDNIILSLANRYNMPALLMKIGQDIQNKQNKIYDAALYPVPTWSPKGGNRVDPALLYAIARQESHFKVNAKNPSGATGLMQLMPATAHYISGQSIYANHETVVNLEDPETSFEIGQTYIERLLNFPSINQDLVSLTIAYNAGPGTLARWKEQHAHITDPLLFIEMIPYPETRAFVERVIANYWIYRMRLYQKTPSLDALAHGNWARYSFQNADKIDRLAFSNQTKPY